VDLACAKQLHHIRLVAIVYNVTSVDSVPITGGFGQTVLCKNDGVLVEFADIDSLDLFVGLLRPFEATLTAWWVECLLVFVTPGTTTATAVTGTTSLLM
jgi:hypothetical protein